MGSAWHVSLGTLVFTLLWGAEKGRNPDGDRAGERAGLRPDVVPVGCFDSG